MYALSYVRINILVLCYSAFVGEMSTGLKANSAPFKPAGYNLK